MAVASMPVGQDVLRSIWIPDLDFLLRAIVADLQLTPSQYANAEEKYRGMARWLEAPESPLRRFGPIRIYPQGSMALRTTVRPIRYMEYDLDAVCQLGPTSLSPMELFELLYRRLQANPDYEGLLERMKRCIRLNYDGNFHLDVIPAEPDPSRNAPCILVPDRKLRDWWPSNPKGLIAWFEGQAAQSREVAKRVEPIPPPEDASEKSVLATAVQVIKRRRDWRFRGDDDAPRSIVLTTLAGLSYRGENTVVEAVYKILLAVSAAVRTAAPRRLEVVNPTNPAERFTDAFTDASYRAFTDFVDSFLEETTALLQLTGGIPAWRDALSKMFGDGSAKRAVMLYGEKLQAVRGAADLRFGPAAGLAIVAPRPDAVRPIRPHNFYGS
jgi:hypothetical protein